MIKTLIFDLETTPNVSYTWHGKYEVDVIEFIEEGYILSFAYKWLGEKSVHAYSVQDFKGNKKKLVEKLHELLDECDVAVAHNGANFDFKWANRAFIQHGMKPVSPYKEIDTLKIARSKFNFNSNKLNDLGKFLGLGEKIDTGGFGLWKKCMAGDKKAFSDMVRYNKQDVVLLEKILNKLVPFAPRTTSMSDTGMVCPSCGSTHLQYRGYTINKVNISRRVQCQDCGRWSTSSLKTKLVGGEYLK